MLLPSLKRSINMGLLRKVQARLNYHSWPFVQSQCMFFLIFCLCYKTQAKLKPIINTRTRFSFIILRCWRFPWPFLVPQTFLPFDAAKASLVEYHSHTENRPLANTHSHTLEHTRGLELQSFQPCAMYLQFYFRYFHFSSSLLYLLFLRFWFRGYFFLFFLPFQFLLFPSLAVAAVDNFVLQTFVLAAVTQRPKYPVQQLSPGHPSALFTVFFTWFTIFFFLPIRFTFLFFTFGFLPGANLLMALWMEIEVLGKQRVEIV